MAGEVAKSTSALDIGMVVIGITVLGHYWKPILSTQSILDTIEAPWVIRASEVMLIYL